MKEVTLELLKQCANNLLFDMDQEQYQTLLEEFATLFKQMELIGKIKDIDSVTPLTFPYPCQSYLREDIEGETLTLEETLKNAKEVEDNQIKLPKVVLWVI